MGDGRFDVLESMLGALEATDRLTSTIIFQLGNLAAEQAREWQDIAALRDELHALAQRHEGLARTVVIHSERIA